MKKVKLNLDKEALKRFFLEHSEKLIFGVVVIGAGLIAFLAVSKASFDRKPEELQQSAANARKHIESTRWIDVRDQYWAPDYVAAVHRSGTAIDPKQYALDKPFDPLIFASMDKRGLPTELLSVENLSVAAGRCAFATGTRAAAGQFNVRGVRWVVIAGTFREAEQAALFEQYYRDTQQHDPQVDVAQYVGYEVQRAEVTGSTAAAGLQWQDLKVDDTLRWMKTLEGKHEKLVADAYINSAIECALLKRHGSDNQDPWPPEIVPISIPSALRRETETPAVDDVQPDPSGPVRLDPFGHPIVEEDPLASAPPDGDPGGDPSGEPGDEAPQLKMFRFFDVLAKPGKTYRYRARLLLKNPNFAMEVRYLKEDDYSAHIPGFKAADPAGTGPATAGAAELVASETICTDWSQPSEALVIPRDTRLLAVTVSPPGPGRENPPYGKVMVINWVNKSGIEAYKDFSVSRGKVINHTGFQFPEAQLTREDRERARERRDKIRKGLRPPRVPRRPRDAVDPIDLDYMTESLVVDLRPGQRSSSQDPWPGPSEILVMNPDGSLAVLNELADQAAYERRTQPEADVKTQAIEDGEAPELPGGDDELPFGEE